MSTEQMSDREFVEWVKAQDRLGYEDSRRIDALADVKHNSTCEIAVLRLDLAAALQRAEAAENQIDKAEESIYSAMAPSGWGKSTHEHHYSRVTYLTNLYLGSVDTIGKFDDKCKAIESKLEAAERALEAAHENMRKMASGDKRLVRFGSNGCLTDDCDHWDKGTCNARESYCRIGRIIDAARKPEEKTDAE